MHYGWYGDIISFKQFISTDNKSTDKKYFWNNKNHIS